MAMPCVACLTLLLAGCGKPQLAPPSAPPLPAGELTLDAGQPLIDTIVDGVPLRLRVDPGQWDVIELNPAVAARLAGLTWEADRTMQIGRIALAGRTAQTVMDVDHRHTSVLVAEHGREAIEEADGVIGPDLLPFAAIRWMRANAPSPGDTLTLPLDLGPATGLTAAAPGLQVPVRLRFSLMRPGSEATAAAGSLLAQRYGGRFDGPSEPMVVLFGVSRPVRPMRFDREPVIIGFRVPRILVRIADFRGDNPLPVDPKAPGEILVAGRDHPQPAASWITIAADHLRQCAEIVYRAQPRALTLSCAFDR